MRAYYLLATRTNDRNKRIMYAIRRRNQRMKIEKPLRQQELSKDMISNFSINDLGW